MGNPWVCGDKRPDFGLEGNFVRHVSILQLRVSDDEGLPFAAFDPMIYFVEPML